MRRSADGGTVLFQRIHCWVKEIEKNILESSQSSPSTKSALRQLQQERVWCSRTVTSKITAEFETKPFSNPARSGRSSYKLIKLLQLLEETEKSETTGIRESTSPSGSITTPDPWWHIIDAQHLKQFPDDFSCFSLITIHPIELARQITLLTHDYICETRLDELRQGLKLIFLIGWYFYRIRIK